MWRSYRINDALLGEHGSRLHHPVRRLSSVHIDNVSGRLKKRCCCQKNPMALSSPAVQPFNRVDYGVVRIAAVTSALNRWRSESGFAGTLCVISTITVWSFGSIQKIVPAVPSHPYSPTFGESFIIDGSTTTFTFASPQPMPPPRARRIGSGKPFAVIRSTVF